MTEEQKERRIKNQRIKIKKLSNENKKLKKKIKELENALYIEDNKRANNKKVTLRVKDIINMYPVAKSTVWLYVKKEYLTPIKNSTRVTTFDAKEVARFFKSINKEAYDNSPKPRDVVTALKAKKRKPQTPKLPKKR